MKLVSSMAGYSRIRATKQKMVANLVTLTLSCSSSRGSCTAHAGTDSDEVRRRHGRYTGHSVVLELSFATFLFSVAGMSGILHSDLHNWQHAICIMSSRDSDRPMTMSSTNRRQSGFDRTMIIDCLRQSVSIAR